MLATGPVEHACRPVPVHLRPGRGNAWSIVPRTPPPPAGRVPGRAVRATARREARRVGRSAPTARRTARMATPRRVERRVAARCGPPPRYEGPRVRSAAARRNPPPPLPALMERVQPEAWMRRAAVDVTLLSPCRLRADLPRSGRNAAWDGLGRARRRHVARTRPDRSTWPERRWPRTIRGRPVGHEGTRANGPDLACAPELVPARALTMLPLVATADRRHRR